MRKVVLSVFALFVLSLVAAACGEDAAAPQIITKEVVVEKEVLVEVPVEVVVEKEVVRTVEVPGKTIVVEKEVVRTVEVAGETIVVTQEVVKEVPVEVVVTKEVIKEVEVRVPFEVIVEKEVVKIVEVQVAFTSFGEAPGLTQKVQAGELPPVNQRVPKDPMLIPMFGEIGKYGGTLRRGYLGPADGCNFFRVSKAGLVRFSSDGLSIVPAVAKELTPNADGSVWTAKLRSGMKWSDGMPFTADDLIFQYKDVILNDELTPGKPPFLRLGASLGEVLKLDDTTVQFSFAQPNFLFSEIAVQADEACFGSTRNIPWAPKHYMSQFINNSALAKSEGFDDWTQLYNNKTQYNLNPDKPAITPWRLTTPLGGQLVRSERNAYFWAVDPAGNQLPYIDGITMLLVADREVLQIKAIAGEIDVQSRHIALEDFPILKDNEKAGGYTILQWPHAGETDAGLGINTSLEGPIGDILKQKDFRNALSHALNRDEMNEISFLGLGVPRGHVPPRGHPFYPGDEVANKYMDFDQDKANALLDGIGLDKRGADGFRQLPDGSDWQLIITATCAFGAWCDIAEQAARAWTLVGVNTKADIVTRSLLSTRLDANESMVTVWNQISAGFIFSAPQHVVPVSSGYQGGPAYGMWYATNGAEGIEPPPEIKMLQDLMDKGPTVGDVERTAIAKQIYTEVADQQYIIATLGSSPMVQGVLIKKNNVHNVPAAAANSWPHRTPNTGFPEQWWFD